MSDQEAQLYIYIYIYIYIFDIDLLSKTLTTPTQMHPNENIPNAKHHAIYKTSSLLAQETMPSNQQRCVVNILGSYICRKVIPLLPWHVRISA